jgi:hypothetical protein
MQERLAGEKSVIAPRNLLGKKTQKLKNCNLHTDHCAKKHTSWIDGFY